MDTTPTPRQQATTAADAVRTLNHLTLSSPANGWEYPSDAYDVLGALASTAHGLPQALEQVSRLLYDLHNAGRVRSDHGEHETAREVLAARGAVRRARELAAQLAAELDAAHAATSALALRATAT